MSSSSTPEPPRAAPRPRGDRGGRAARSSTSTSARSASGAAARGARRRLGDARAGRCPGFLWLGFYLVAPLVFIVLVSFWTRTDTGLRQGTGRRSNYGALLHPFNLDNAYWKNMLTVVRDVA